MNSSFEIALVSESLSLYTFHRLIWWKLYNFIFWKTCFSDVYQAKQKYIKRITCWHSKESTVIALKLLKLCWIVDLADYVLELYFFLFLNMVCWPSESNIGKDKKAACQSHTKISMSHWQKKDKSAMCKSVHIYLKNNNKLGNKTSVKLN